MPTSNLSRVAESMLQPVLDNRASPQTLMRMESVSDRDILWLTLKRLQEAENGSYAAPYFLRPRLVFVMISQTDPILNLLKD